MAKGFIAISNKKKVFELSKTGIENLKFLHSKDKSGKYKGWQYGSKSELKELLSKVVTPQEAQNAIAENARLKAEIEELKAKKVSKTEK